MSKYSRLGAYLRAQDHESLQMSFADVERVAGIKLPPSAGRHRAWWSNNPENNVATKEWLAAGYLTEDVDLANKTLVFRKAPPDRVAEAPVAAWGSGPGAGTQGRAAGHDPLFGALRDLIHIAPGVDLTEPADPEWGER